LPTLKRPGRLVVDANPILSALLGGVARRIFFEADVREFAVADRVLQEVISHIPRLALKTGLDAALLRYSLGLLPLTQYQRNSYRLFLPEAARRIGDRDPDDVDALALTLSQRIPLWTNDRDFEDAGIEALTTAHLFTLFFGRSAR